MGRLRGCCHGQVLGGARQVSSWRTACALSLRVLGPRVCHPAPLSAPRPQAFVVVGDFNGHVGLGVKCAKEVATAIRGAIILAKMACVPVRRGYWGNRRVQSSGGLLAGGRGCC